MRIAINPWVGYEASAAVVAYLLAELGYKVELRGTGGRVLEGLRGRLRRCDHRELGPPGAEAGVHRQKKVAVSAGLTGNKGVIGWYVPEWMAQRYPEITDLPEAERSTTGPVQDGEER